MPGCSWVGAELIGSGRVWAEFKPKSVPFFGFSSFFQRIHGKRLIWCELLFSLYFPTGLDAPCFELVAMSGLGSGQPKHPWLTRYSPSRSGRPRSPSHHSRGRPGVLWTQLKTPKSIGGFHDSRNSGRPNDACATHPRGIAQLRRRRRGWLLGHRPEHHDPAHLSNRPGRGPRHFLCGGFGHKSQLPVEQRCSST